jgi:chemotaxis-related protein WspD
MMETIDDCWNRIGVMGDASCPELIHHIHCRNCPVYAAAARRLLDVPAPAGERDFWTERFASTKAPARDDGRSTLIFRSAQEWFGLPTTACVEVAGLRPIRTLPHRRDPAVMGLANVRGELMVCVSLAVFLRLTPAPDAATPRLLVVKGDGEPTALHVDEVHGTYRYTQAELQSVPDTLAGSATRHTESVLRWRDRTVGLLDAGALLAGLDRCLA